MIQLTVEHFRFGTLVVSRAASDAFEIIRLTTGNTGIPIARVAVERTVWPALQVSKLQPQERSINTRAMVVVESAVLVNWSDETPTQFELRAAGTGDDVKIVLSGHCQYRCFCWWAEFKLMNDEVVVRGPFLADDPVS